MIVFDLACPGGHVFEAWFGSSEDYEAQRTRGLVSCPMCGAGDVTKAVMAPNVAPKGNSRPSSTPPSSLPMRSGAAAPDAAEVKAMLRALAEAQAKALAGSDYVGGRFAEEARAMHDGAVDHRSIHGEATLAEARALLEDGVPVAPLPLPVRPPGTDN